MKCMSVVRAQGRAEQSRAEQNIPGAAKLPAVAPTLPNASATPTAAPITNTPPTAHAATVAALLPPPLLPPAFWVLTSGNGCVFWSATALSSASICARRVSFTS
jgi:hypothetical protein